MQRAERAACSAQRMRHSPPLFCRDRARSRRAAAQPALTRYRTLERITLPLRADRYPESRYALVEACPETGRTHQIRRHLKHLGHPIAGDTTHGVGAHNRLWRSALGCHRMLLACTGLDLLHPRSGAPLVLQAAPAESFALPWEQARRMSLQSGTLAASVPP